MFQRRSLERVVTASIRDVSAELSDVLLTSLREELEGRCITEGFIEPGSISLIGYSMGRIEGARLSYRVRYQANVLFPTEGLEVTATVRSVTKMGLECTSGPALEVIVPRDHYVASPGFQALATGGIGGTFQAVILAARWNYGDTKIVAFAELKDDPVIPPELPEEAAPTATAAPPPAPAAVMEVTAAAPAPPVAPARPRKRLGGGGAPAAKDEPTVVTLE